MMDDHVVMAQENAKLRKVVELFIEELDDPCRRNQREPNQVWISQALERLARSALT